MNFHLTTAGLAAFVNPNNTGSNAITIDRIGVSSVALPGDPASHTGMLALPNELKRLSTFAGANVGDNVIHVTVRDETTDVYTLRTFGLYASTGVLLAYVTSGEPINEKSPSSMTLIAADFAFVALAAEVVFGSTDFLNPPATSETAGVVELATAAETATGTDASRAVTPFGLKSLLATLLAGFSSTGHQHPASDIVSGILAVARIPDLAQSKISGLVDALASKASSIHGHAMSEITGLVAALGLKLAIADFTWANLVGKPNVAINGQDAAFNNVSGAQISGTQIRVTAPAGTGWAGLIPGTPAGVPGYLTFVNGAGVEVGYVGWKHGQHNRLMLAGQWPYEFSSRPYFAGAVPWDDANFNPADKAAAIHSHDWSQITGKPAVWHSLNLDPSTKADLSGAAFTGPVSVPHLEMSGGGLADRVVNLRSSTNYNWSLQTAGDHLEIREAGDAAKVRMRISYPNGDVDFQSTNIRAGGFGMWHTGNFNPADKAAAIHSHDWSQITGKPALAIRNDNNVFRDVTVDRGDNTGVFYFVGAGRYVWYDGQDFEFFGGQLKVEGQRVQTAADRASAANFRAGSVGKLLQADQVWAAAELSNAAQAATITLDMGAGLNFSTTMTGNRTLGAPANAKPGQSGVLQIIQDGTGGRTLAFDAAWKFEGGTDPVLSTAANARDVLVFTVIGPSDVVASLMKDVK